MQVKELGHGEGVSRASKLAPEVWGDMVSPVFIERASDTEKRSDTHWSRGPEMYRQTGTHIGQVPHFLPPATPGGRHHDPERGGWTGLRVGGLRPEPSEHLGSRKNFVVCGDGPHQLA